MDALPYATADPVMSLLTAVFTPFDEDGGLALDTVERQADAVLAWGSPAVYVGGTAGEGASLSTAERMLLLERWCEVADGRLDVIAHVGHTSLGEARALAEHAQRAGARAISAVPPYFHRPDNAAALADFVARLVEAAPGLPFIYYHIPSVTGVGLPAGELLRAARERVPGFAGVKFAHGDLADLQVCLKLAEETPGCEVYVGSARLLLASLALGARAAIGSAYNFAAPLYRRMLDHVARGEQAEARACQFLAQEAIDAACGYAGELAGFKAASALVGPDCGPCRPPLRSLDAGQRAALRAALTRMGFLEAVAAPGAAAAAPQAAGGGPALRPPAETAHTLEGVGGHGTRGAAPQGARRAAPQGNGGAAPGGAMGGVRGAAPGGAA
ncbi:dihydrodipicolinate synthase family protein [Streptomyces sp. 6N223]|uniref:dihydrodipicolinate synthase family protein n=1 Tax=Streptomyces sp. 6N223 TaxID=3457412 RepID=UPI003FD626AC